MAEVRKRQGWGLIEADDIEDGALDGIVTLPPEYIEGGRLDRDLSGGTVTTSFKNVVSFSDVSLTSGDKMLLIIAWEINGRISKTTQRTFLFEVLLGSTVLRSGNITFNSKARTTKTVTLVGVYEATGTLTGALVARVRVDSTECDIKETASNWSFYARIPNQT